MNDKAECPVCGEIITFGTPAKLHRSLICLTCLTNLQVVALTPLELDVLVDERPAPRSDGHRSKKSAKGKKERRGHGSEGVDDDLDDFADDYVDDYVLEKRLRRKPNRDKRRRNKGWDE